MISYSWNDWINITIGTTVLHFNSESGKTFVENLREHVCGRSDVKYFSIGDDGYSQEDYEKYGGENTIFVYDGVVVVVVRGDIACMRVEFPIDDFINALN
jgi:hypothetical protein